MHIKVWKFTFLGIDLHPAAQYVMAPCMRANVQLAELTIIDACASCKHLKGME
jgi:hypothetical protein